QAGPRARSRNRATALRAVESCGEPLRGVRVGIWGYNHRARVGSEAVIVGAIVSIANVYSMLSPEVEYLGSVDMGAVVFVSRILHEALADGRERSLLHARSRRCNSELRPARYSAARRPGAGLRLVNYS